MKNSKRKPKLRKATIEVKSHEATPVPVISDALVASVTVGDGRMIPLVIVNAAGRPDISEVIRVHQLLKKGDVASVWMQSRWTQGGVSLLLEFLTPVQSRIILDFDVFENGLLIEAILRAKGIVLLSGAPGDRASTTMDAPRLTVEIPPGDFNIHWPDLSRSRIISELVKRGHSRSEAEWGAEQLKRERQELLSIRMPNY